MRNVRDEEFKIGSKIMKRRTSLLGLSLGFLATASHAGFVTPEEQICPVGGQKFEVISSPSCSSGGLSHDFFFLRPSSCDFVTRLPQCPDNKLPLYKEFTKKEIELLQDYINTPEYKANEAQSRFYLAKKVDDFLISKGSAAEMNFDYLLYGLQYDRENTQDNAQYRQWVIDTGTAEMATEPKDSISYMRLIMAYTHYLAGQFDQAQALLDAAKVDTVIADSELAQAYIKRVGVCVAAKDTKLCPSTERVIPGEDDL
jgi:hypothetical protein